MTIIIVYTYSIVSVSDGHANVYLGRCGSISSVNIYAGIKF